MGKEYTDVELLDQIAQKQPWALDALYDRHAARLNGLAIKVLQDPFLAEEVLQEVFLKLWEQPELFSKERGTPVVWLMVACRNRCIDKLRTEQVKRQRTRTLDEALAFEEDLWVIQDVVAEIDYQDLHVRVTRALHALPVEQSEPIELAFFQGYSQTEIAKRLDLPVGTVKTRMRLGMQKLRNVLTRNREHR